MLDLVGSRPDINVTEFARAAVGTIPFYAAAAAFLTVMDRVFCPYGEAKPEREFGGTYVEYRSRVKRWL